MTLIESIILGIVQGLTEFLPVSSSGHLALLQHFFNIDGEKVLLFSVMLHMGTLFSLIVVYYKTLWDLILELFATIADLVKGRGLQMDKNETRKLGIMIVVATIPTALIGLLFNDFFESLYTSIMVIGFALIVTGAILIFAEKVREQNLNKSLKEMKLKDAIFVGICQGIAIVPGISRSGATISGSLVRGLKRETAIKFAFLISFPTILGAGILEIPKALAAGTGGEDMGVMLVGMAFAAAFGIAAIKSMIKIVTDKKLYMFSVYTGIVGLAVVVYSFVGM